MRRPWAIRFTATWLSPGEKAGAETAVTEVTLKDAKSPPGNATDVQLRTQAEPADPSCGRDVEGVDAVCTHLGCTVQFQPDQNRIHLRLPRRRLRFQDGRTWPARRRSRSRVTKWRSPSEDATVSRRLDAIMKAKLVVRLRVGWTSGWG